MTTTFLNSTERGQITLPKKWRSRFPSTSYRVEMFDDRLVVIPFVIDTDADEEILFDADRDNDGTGVSPDEIINELQKLIRQR